MSPLKFFPCADRASVIDLRMRQVLGESIEHIAEQCSGVITVDAEALFSLAEGLKQGFRYPPTTFALYTELVFAIQGEDYTRASKLIADLEKERPLNHGSWEIIALGERGQENRDRHYRQLMDSDPTASFELLPPSPGVAASFSARFQSGFKLMEAAIPELAKEIANLVSQVIMVRGDSSAKYQFDGGSCYMLWGGLFLNAESHETDVAMVEVLAHESAHILLFGFASDEPLVVNDDDQLFPSPLRIDPRPMDGIYHSTFVSARMHWAMSELLKFPALDRQSREFAEAARAADRKNFFAGYRVVEEYGELTETGRAVMTSALDYMKTA